MKALIQTLLVIIILALGVGFTFYMFKTKPEVVKKPVEQRLPVVEVVTLATSRPAVVVQTQGEFVPPRESTLSAQVSGEVVYVSEKFDLGGMFEKGEVILKIDETDYRTAVVNAQANKVQAELGEVKAQAAVARVQAEIKDAEAVLEIEKARKAQALRDWEKLGRGAEPSALLVRKPQIAAAEARIASTQAALREAKASILQAEACIKQAQANVVQAERNLDRVVIKAPYDCQVASKELDLGALASMGAPLCNVYERGSIKARVPVSQADAGFITVGTTQVVAKAMIGAEMKEWEGVISRSENRIDPQTRSTYLVALFEGDDLPPVGMFAQIEIQGGEMAPVMAVPRIALMGRDQVIVVNEDDRVSFRTVTVARTTTDEVYLSAGVDEGERVCVTVVSTPVEGMQVDVIE